MSGNQPEKIKEEDFQRNILCIYSATELSAEQVAIIIDHLERVADGKLVVEATDSHTLRPYDRQAVDSIAYAIHLFASRQLGAIYAIASNNKLMEHYKDYIRIIAYTSNDALEDIHKILGIERISAATHPASVLNSLIIYNLCRSSELTSVGSSEAEKITAETQQQLQQWLAAFRAIPKYEAAANRFDALWQQGYLGIPPLSGGKAAKFLA